LFSLYKPPSPKASAGKMENKGQLMGVPIKLVMALVIGTMTMGILMQFVGTAERTVLRDMKVTFGISSNKLTVKVFDVQSGDNLSGATIVVKYPDGMKAYTLGQNSSQYTFTLNMNGASVVVATVRVTRNGYIPWEGQAAIGG
jgi:hypothetical protein